MTESKKKPTPKSYVRIYLDELSQGQNTMNPMIRYRTYAIVDKQKNNRARGQFNLYVSTI